MSPLLQVFVVAKLCIHGNVIWFFINFIKFDITLITFDCVPPNVISSIESCWQKYSYNNVYEFCYIFL